MTPYNFVKKNIMTPYNQRDMLYSAN